MAFIYDLTDTWNAGGTTFNAIKMNVTDTASAAASKLITVQVSGSEKFSVKKDGVGYFASNVGIGTNLPAGKLTINTGAGQGINLYRSTANANFDGITFKDTANSSTNGRIGWNANELRVEGTSVLSLHTASTEAMRITSTGSVGIGTSSPSALLDVAGDAEINGLTVGLGGGSVTTNTAYGIDALSSNTTGNYNTASGYQALYSNTTGNYNTASGYLALQSNTTGNNNTASGFQTLNSNTTGANNTASGLQVLRYNTTGNNNTASGFQTLNSNTTGVNNTASGFRPLFSNTTGNNNAAYGYLALYSNTTGSENTASGRDALNSNTTGNNNTAFGYQALLSNTTGSGGTASGIQALRSNTTGGLNTASGRQAGYDNTEGTRNTYIGYNTGRGITTGNYNTIVGAGVTGLSASLSNNVIIADGQGNRRINIDSSGNIGVGTTSPSALLHVETQPSGGGVTPATSADELVLENNSNCGLTIATENLGSIYFGKAADNDIGRISYSMSDNSMRFTTNNTERMRIDSSGNVGIANAIPSTFNTVNGAGNLVVGSGSGAEGITVYSGTTSNGALCFADGITSTDTYKGYVQYNHSTDSMQFATVSTERMRIDSSGNLLVGQTSVSSTGGVEIQPDVSGLGFGRVEVDSAYNGTAQSFQFKYLGTGVGSIAQTTTSTAYNTSSDARLKHDIVDAPEASDLIDSIQVRSFKWNADDSEQRYGMVAQELIEVAPEAVSVPQDEDEMMGVDYSKLVPMLVKEIQSMRLRLAQLEG